MPPVWVVTSVNCSPAGRVKGSSKDGSGAGQHADQRQALDLTHPHRDPVVLDAQRRRGADRETAPDQLDAAHEADPAVLAVRQAQFGAGDARDSGDHLIDDLGTRERRGEVGE